MKDSFRVRERLLHRLARARVDHLDGDGHWILREQRGDARYLDAFVRVLDSA